MSRVPGMQSEASVKQPKCTGGSQIGIWNVGLPFAFLESEIITEVTDFPVITPVSHPVSHGRPW